MLALGLPGHRCPAADRHSHLSPESAPTLSPHCLSPDLIRQPRVLSVLPTSIFTPFSTIPSSTSWSELGKGKSNLAAPT